jgi:hypothetical protein
MRASGALILLALLAFASSAFAIRPYPPAPPTGDILVDLGLSVQDIMRSVAINTPPAFPPISEIVRTPEDECCDCVGRVAEHIIESILDAVEEACANVSCPIIKARCEWIEAHTDEFVGFVTQRVRPHTDGFMYCMGTGECKHPNVTGIDEGLFVRPASSHRFQQLGAANLFLERMEIRKKLENNPSQLGQGGEPYFLDPAVELPSDMDMIGSDEFVGADNRQKCKKCIVGSTKWVMKHSMDSFAHYCEHPKCPKVKEFCKWARSNLGFIKGMLYGHVEPYKYGVGWCFGKGKCKKGASEPAEAVENAAVNVKEETKKDKKKHHRRSNL